MFKGLAIVSLLLTACAKPTPTPAPSTPTPAPGEVGFANPELVVETDWLAQHLDDPDLRIVDVRTADDYLQGHIPNAVSLPKAQLDDPDNPIKGMVLPKEKIESLLGGVGISNETTVVVVCSNGGHNPPRLFWILEYYRHKKVGLLNGGLNKWQKEGREVARAVPKIAIAQFTARVDPSTIATKQYVLDNLENENVVIVDARSDREYAGEDVRSKRGGHIPGAVNVNWENHWTTGDVPVLKTAAELTKLYEHAGVTKDREVIFYSQTATRSSHTYFVLRLLGYDKIRNYDGSWEEWGNDTEVPIEK